VPHFIALYMASHFTNATQITMKAEIITKKWEKHTFSKKISMWNLELLKRQSYTVFEPFGPKTLVKGFGIALD
jgi:hypothetical protein